MEIKRYEFILAADTPIAHHSESIGNSAVAMRQKIRQPDGTFSTVPIITADTMRHGLREASTYALLDAAGMLDAGSLSEAALRLLFAGGMVTGRGDASAVKLADYRVLCDLVPPMSLLGGCADNRVIPGRLNVGSAMLVCEETEHLIPEWVLAWARARGQITSSRTHVEEVQRVRMDPTLDPAKTKLLAAEAQTGVQHRLVTSADAGETGDAIARDAAKSTMMPRRYETIVAGSLFSWHVQAACYSALDVDTFDAMCSAFLANARVGGKRGTGHGQIRALAANEVPVLRPSEQAHALTFDGARCGEIFRAHVAERRDRIVEFLRTVNA